MDKLLRAEIVSEVKRSMAEISEMYNEVWLTGDKLGERFGMFNPGWLKAYGHTLPRTQAIVRDGDSKEHRSSWVYPAHKIARMIAEGGIKNLCVIKQ